MDLLFLFFYIDFINYIPQFIPLQEYQSVHQVSRRSWRHEFKRHLLLKGEVLYAKSILCTRQHSTCSSSLDASTITSRLNSQRKLYLLIIWRTFILIMLHSEGNAVHYRMEGFGVWVHETIWGRLSNAAKLFSTLKYQNSAILRNFIITWNLLFSSISKFISIIIMLIKTVLHQLQQSVILL